MSAKPRNFDQMEDSLGVRIPPAEGTACLPETARSLAHDLRSPLASLQSCLSLVLNGEAGELTSDQKRFLGLARRNIDRLDRMVEDMLASSRDRSGDVPVRRRETDLGPTLAEAVRLHRIKAAEKRITIDDTGLPVGFPALVDPDLVVRLLDNVLGNAVKHGRMGGMVRVWLESGVGTPRSLAVRLARQSGVSLATFNLIVEDNGPGLAPEIQSRLFEPYNPGSGSAGTGLGLSVIRRLAAAHGGQVRLASLPGRGTTVWLKLPRDPDSEHFLRTVARLEDDLAHETPSGVLPLAGVLDLRPNPGILGAARRDLGEFFRRRPSGGAPGREPAPGLWVAAVMDPVNWNRRWALFAARKGGGLEATRWDFLPHRTGREELDPTGTKGKQRETMVNPGV